MCDRHTGIGADGLILYELRDRGATMRLLNADGSPSELSGNGLRCLAALVAREQKLRPGDDRHGRDRRRREDARAAGARRAALHVPGRAGPARPTSARSTIPVLGETVTASVLRMGNPQCVVLGPLPDAERFNRLGPALSTHAMFPAGTNVEFAHVEAPDRVRILIWERGVGPTTLVGNRLLGLGRRGGRARRRRADARRRRARRHPARRVADDGVYLTGWAEIVLEGTLDGQQRVRLVLKITGRP